MAKRSSLVEDFRSYINGENLYLTRGYAAPYWIPFWDYFARIIDDETGEVARRVDEMIESCKYTKSMYDYQEQLKDFYTQHSIKLDPVLLQNLNTYISSENLSEESILASFVTIVDDFNKKFTTTDIQEQFETILSNIYTKKLAHLKSTVTETNDHRQIMASLVNVAREKVDLYLIMSKNQPFTSKSKYKLMEAIQKYFNGDINFTQLNNELTKNNSLWGKIVLKWHIIWSTDLKRSLTAIRELDKNNTFKAFDRKSTPLQIPAGAVPDILAKNQELLAEKDTLAKRAQLRADIIKDAKIGITAEPTLINEAWNEFEIPSATLNATLEKMQKKLTEKFKKFEGQMSILSEKGRNYSYAAQEGLERATAFYDMLRKHLQKQASNATDLTECKNICAEIHKFLTEEYKKNI